MNPREDNYTNAIFMYRPWKHFKISMWGPQVLNVVRGELTARNLKIA